MIVYVAGPMSGLPEYNYPAFHAAADRLRALGYDVLNPVDAELVNPTPGIHQSWEWYMREALKMVISSDAIALLPGWENSRGAKLEHHIGTQLGMTIKPLDEWLTEEN